MIVDGGEVEIGVESTIVDVSSKNPTLLRPGAVTIEMLEEVLGHEIEIDPVILGPVQGDVKPKAPGMKYRHYAPKANMTLVEAENTADMVNKICELAEEASSQGYRVGVICTDETKHEYPAEWMVKSMGLRKQEETIAHNLFAVLREFDDAEVEYIYSETFPKDHIGQAIMNRLSKAAGYHIVKIL